MHLYEQTICDDCLEEKICRRTNCGINTDWICEDCHQIHQLEVQAAYDAEFDNMRYRLTPKGEQLLARMP